VDASAESDKGVAALNESIKEIELNDEMPDTAVMHPEFTKVLFDTSQSGDNLLYANQLGDDEGIRDRVAFPLLGLQGFRASGGTADSAAGTFGSTTTWDYTGVDEYGAVVYDQNRVGMYLFNDIEMKEYEDPIRDLQGVNARMEVDHVYHQPDAAARIKDS
jgi:hypothetical protein